MDRNSTIGLVLIGLIITVFSVMNQPSEAEIKAAQKKEATQQKAAASKVKAKKEGKKGKSRKSVLKTLRMIQRNEELIKQYKNK